MTPRSRDAAAETPGDEPARIVGLIEGDPRTALSGVGRFLLDALERRDLPVVDRVDYGFGGIQRAAVAAATIRLSKETWRARFHTSRLSHRLLSGNLRRRAAALGDFDVALQVHGWVSGQPRPYVLYVDQTRLMAERGWPTWMPFTTRERDELLDLELGMYADAAHIFVMGEPARESLQRDYEVDSGRITVAGGGLPFDEPPVPGPLTPEPTLLFVGRDFGRKGGEVLLKAFGRVRDAVPNATLHVVGATRRFGQPGVIGHGRLERQAVAALYRRSRVFCMPSLYEPYGFALIEAMAHGIPTVGSDVQSIPEILDAGNAGLVVPAGDAAALADALLGLLQDDDLARRYAQAGPRRVASQLTWDHVAARMAPTLGEIQPGDLPGVSSA